MCSRRLVQLLFLLHSVPSYAIHSESFVASPQAVAGTPAREELEFKFAFIPPAKLDSRTLRAFIENELRPKLAALSFQTSEGFGVKVGVDDEYQSFAFRDRYFDTKDRNILKIGSAYRLRYRWASFANFARYSYLPFVRTFYPTRCEIQYKSRYEHVGGTDVLRARESRFEFRNASKPFSKHLDAPEAPWPVEEYSDYAKSGYFREYRMQPAADLVEDLGQLREIDLEEALLVDTMRIRTHVSMFPNPWASGPNPNQIFILTFDLSRFETKERESEQRLMEVEIEIDRNISTVLEQAIDEGDFGDSPLTEFVGSTSSDIKETLEADMRTIGSTVKLALNDGFELTPLGLDYKYARMMKMAGNE